MIKNRNEIEKSNMLNYDLTSTIFVDFGREKKIS